MMWHDGYWKHGASWEGWAMFFFMIVFVVAIVVASAFLVRYLTQQSNGASAAAASPAQAVGPEPPEDILKLRYAGGKIERELHLQILEELDQP